jgi:sulfatase modifying factor 1
MRVLATAGLSLCLVACDTEVSPASGGAGSGGAGGAPAVPTCPDREGLWSMVPITRANGYSFCIDSREVTNEQYAAFLEAPASPTDEHCDAGIALTPMARWPADPGRERHPVTAVTWCQAQAFCSAYGKRLCGGEQGEVLTFDETNNEELKRAETEMWTACTKDGAQTYAYGNEGEVGRCVDSPLWPDDLEAADAETRCEGGYPGVFHLQGNAREWEAGCRWLTLGEGLIGAYCSVRGDGCEFDEGYVGNGEGPNDWSEYFGFRCCADPLE